MIADFLKTLRKRANVPTVREHYDLLGGREVLGITLRYFQLVESGKQIPSAVFISNLFERIPPESRKDLIVEFFKSVSSDDSQIVRHLTQNWMPAPPIGQDNFYNNTKRMVYSEEQLDYLLNHPCEMRFHKSLMLRREIDIEKIESSVDLCTMQKMELISFEEGKVIPSRRHYTLPHHDHHHPSLVSKATDYILKHIELYISKEGSSAQQELTYAFQWVPNGIANEAIQRLRDFKKWLLSHATDPGVDRTPFITVAFMKKLNIKEF